MNYHIFYQDIANWIMQVNQMAGRYGMHSNEFWDWVMQSSVSICEKYKNNKLVLNQMVMLYLWLESVYEEGVAK